MQTNQNEVEVVQYLIEVSRALLVLKVTVLNDLESTSKKLRKFLVSMIRVRKAGHSINLAGNILLFTPLYYAGTVCLITGSSTIFATSIIQHRFEKRYFEKCIKLL